MTCETCNTRIPLKRARAIEALNLRHLCLECASVAVRPVHESERQAYEESGEMLASVAVRLCEVTR